MAIGRMNYKQLTPEQRREGAEKARERLRGTMMSPALTADQQAYLKAEMVKIDAWEACGLGCAGEHDHPDDPPPS